LRFATFRPAQEQRQELRSAQSLPPDAPSAVLAKEHERLQAFVEARSPLIFDGATIKASMARESPEHVAFRVMSTFSVLYGAPVVQKESNVFFDKYLYSSLLREGMRYRKSTSDNFRSSVGTNHRRYAMRRRQIPLVSHSRMPECGPPWPNCPEKNKEMSVSNMKQIDYVHTVTI
jgi:hypothetical protein